MLAELERNHFRTNGRFKVVNFLGQELTEINRLRAANFRSRHSIHRELQKEMHIEERDRK